MKLGAYPIFNFSGGIRKDKSPLELDKNELTDARNVEIDEKGRVKARRGAYQFGTTTSGTVRSSYVFTRHSTASNTRVTTFLRVPGAIEILRTTRITADVGTGSTTISVVSTTGFNASGTIEIDGDLITYTGLGGGGTTFTGCSGITSAHLADQTTGSVNQWVTLTQPGTAIDATSGVYFATLNNTLIINSVGTWKSCTNNDGETLTDLGTVSPTLFVTNYRDRCYAAGNGNGATTNGLPEVISFSSRGDGTTWAAADNFTVEDQRGEMITALRVLNDRMLIFKTNSIFTYDEIELKQRLSNVGAWNHSVPIEIDGLIYTFCPEGIFATNGVEAKSIGEPVRMFWESARPIYDSNRRIERFFSASRLGKKYVLYIDSGNLDTETLNDYLLVYDTIYKNWVVYSGGFTDAGHLAFYTRWKSGDNDSQKIPALFLGDSSGRMFRFNESTYFDSNDTIRGRDFFQDLFSNTGTPIASTFETPLYDLTHPDLYKKFNDMTLFVEQGVWHVSYRVMNEKGVSEYQPLGDARYPYTKIPFPPSAQGWRIGFRFSTVDTNSTPIFSGFILENTEVLQR